MKNKMKKVVMLFAAMTFVTVGSLQAQSFGVKAGVNFQNMNTKANGKSKSFDLGSRFHIGVDYDIPIAPDFYFQPGLLFSTKGANDIFSGENEALNELEDLFNDMWGGLVSSLTLLIYLQLKLKLYYLI